MEGYRRECSDPKAVTLVAESEGRIIGYANLWNVAGDVTLNNIAVHFEFAEYGSGAAYYVLSGDDIQTQQVVLVSGTSVDTTFNFDSDTEDGQKTLSVVVYDNAGNASIAATTTITLDTQLDTPTLALQTPAG